MYSLPKLYKVDAKGKECVWYIKGDEDRTITKYGKVGGKLVVKERKFDKVNKGNKNEVDKYEQTKRMAERLWIKKLGTGYKPKTEEGKELEKRIKTAQSRSGNVNTGLDKLIRNTSGGEDECDLQIADNGTLYGFNPNIRPMLCNKWENKTSVLKYFNFKSGVFLQPKLDGVRALIQLKKVGDEYHTVMTTRNMKQIVYLNHLRQSVKELLYPKYKNVILDCELYVHKIKGKTSKERFNFITEACRVVRKIPHPNENLICIYIFDIVDTTKTQSERWELLDEILEENEDKSIKRVDTCTIYSVDEIEEKQEEYVNKTYEGVVLRSESLMYEEGKKSPRMRKYKRFQDSEFEIVGSEKDPGVDDGYFVWICKTQSGKKFKVPAGGTEKEREKLYKNRKKYIGSLLTVKYQEELTKDDDVPRFPKFVAIRNYEG